MSKIDLQNKIDELEIRMNRKFTKLKSMIGVIQTMIEEEHFFPEAISRELDCLESLINYDD